MSDEKKIKIEMTADEAGFMLNALEARKIELENDKRNDEIGPFELVELNGLRRLFDELQNKYDSLK